MYSDDDWINAASWEDWDFRPGFEFLPLIKTRTFAGRCRLDHLSLSAWCFVKTCVIFCTNALSHQPSHLIGICYKVQFHHHHSSSLFYAINALCTCNALQSTLALPYKCPNQLMVISALTTRTDFFSPHCCFWHGVNIRRWRKKHLLLLLRFVFLHLLFSSCRLLW